MNGWMLTALIVAGVIALIVKRFLGEPLNARDLCLPPLVLVGLGVYSLTKVDVIDARDVMWLVAASLVGVALGAVRGTTTVLYTREGHLWQRYTVGTVLVWAFSLGVNFGVGYLASLGGMHPEARKMTLSIGAGLLGEMITVGLRALRTGHRFAPDKDDSPARRLLERR
ncbi:DUF1453 domain-containing protein [Phytomonospora sp. NPDC050363]|uniref:DUF1453 domain-containing protein n=1 Tax=Phytomonospora sp. NPDC050363 TaxID=3155642 RepID=UPI0033CC1DC9